MVGKEPDPRVGKMRIMDVTGHTGLKWHIANKGIRHG